MASKASPETLTVWHNGRVILHTLANTGIPAAPTADGTSRCTCATRSRSCGHQPGRVATTPTRSSWVSYFDGGEAVHYFPRGFYGAPQSLGCVELPYAQAALRMAVHDLRDAGHRPLAARPTAGADRLLAAAGGYRGAAAAAPR